MKLTLCGSARFEAQWHYWSEKLIMSGHTVYSLAVFPSSKGGEKNWYNDREKMLLDLVHLSKIEESDGIVVLNIDGYIGLSTRREIVWAEIRGKDIWWFDPPEGQDNAHELLGGTNL